MTRAGGSAPAWVTASAPAKVNLHLGVGALRPDGLHPLATVYHAIGLLDEVTVRPAPAYGVTVSGDERLALEEVPTDDSNIAVRAARLLAERHGIEEQVAVHIDKQIPVAGGLAGGSADAAAALVACDALWELQTPREALAELAAELGSDVPFALVGGTAIGTGRGEVVVPAMVRGDYWWVVVGASFGLSTAAVYREFDAMHARQQVPEPEIPEALMEALRNRDLEKLSIALDNDLEDPALRLRPEIQQALTAGLGAGCLAAQVSGSGPSTLLLCESQAHAQQVAADVAAQGFSPALVAHGPASGARVERTGAA